METMINTIVEIMATLITNLVIIAITVAFAWLSSKIGQNKHLANINRAKDELQHAAIQTVGELNQRFVETWKSQATYGKLTEAQIANLKMETVNLTLAKMSTSAIKLLDAAGVDLEAYIHGAADDYISSLKNGKADVGLVVPLK